MTFQATLSTHSPPVVHGAAAVPDSTTSQPMASGWRRLAYLLLAAITLGLSVVGMVLSGVPTTPFLLVTSWLLVRSSQQMHDALLQNKICGQLLRDWQTQRALRRSVRRKAVAAILLVVGFTLIWGGLSLQVKAFAALGAACGLVVVSRLPVLD